MKKIEALLLVAVCVLSFVCYQQHKQIKRLESDLSYLDDKFDSIDSKQEELESKQEEMKISIGELQEEMEEHFPRPTKTVTQQRQEYIEEIKRYNAKREEELQAGIKNTDKNKDLYRNWLQFIKNRYNIDIEIK